MSRLLIAGCGIAGGAMALRAMQLGFSPVLLRVAGTEVGGVEIIPSGARHLLEALDLGPVLAAARPRLARGLMIHDRDGHDRDRHDRGDQDRGDQDRGDQDRGDQDRGDQDPDGHDPDGGTRFRSGRALHVDRLTLRALVLAEARDRGAEIRDVDHLPVPEGNDYAIDATGRRAAWSRPVIRYGRQWADLFSLPFPLDGEVGHLSRLNHGWAYAASDQARTTIGVISEGRHRAPVRLMEAARAFGLDPAVPARHLGRRPAFPQAAETPLLGRRIAIGDAAFCHDPIGGRGISFAIGSAFAASAVLRTWRDHPANAALAASYYRDYVQAETNRHLRFLAAPDIAPIAPVRPAHVAWCGREARRAVAMPEGIAEDDAVLTRDGAAVRWLGRLDVLTLRAICREPAAVGAVLAALEAAGLARDEAGLAIDWALTHGILGPAPF